MKLKCPYQLSISTIQPGNFERKHDKLMCNPRLFRMNVRRINTKRRKGQSKQIKYLDFLLIWIIWNINNSKNVDNTKISGTTTVLLIYLERTVVSVFTLKGGHKNCCFMTLQGFIYHRNHMWSVYYCRKICPCESKCIFCFDDAVWHLDTSR